MHEQRGTFRVADESREVSGAILTDPTTGRVRLELDDSLADTAPFALSSHPVVHGQLIDGSPVALLDCFQTRSGIPSTTDQTSAASYSCAFFVLGARVYEDEPYSQFTLCLTDLVSWIGQKGFLLHSDLSSAPPVFTAKTAPPFLAEADTSRGRVRFKSGPALNAGHRSAEFGTNALIEVLPEKEVTLSDILSRYVRPFQDLLTIAVGRPQDVTDLRVAPSRSVGLGESPQDGREWAQVRFPRWSDTPVTSDSPFPDQMLFSLSDLQASLSGGVEAWFKLDDEVHGLRSLATAPAYRSAMFVDQRFLYAAHAIETYHRRRLGGFERSREEHKELIKEIIGAAPQAHRKWLKTKLAFSNELSLLDRLVKVRSKVCEKAEHLLSSVNDWEQWIRDTRNFHTHFTKPRRRSRIARGKRLLALTESLLLVIDDMILMELGLSEFARNERLGGTDRYQRLAQWTGECDWTVP